MELNITKFFNDACPKDYSASCHEIGQDAANATWTAAIEDATDYNFIDTEDKRAEFRAYVKTFGAWDQTEIDAWSHTELNALFIQLISGDMREACAYDDETGTMDWEQYEKDSEAGQCGGNLFRGVDGQVWYQF